MTTPGAEDSIDRTPRRQVERSEATQAALLDATISCLVDYGYGGTTTRVVADRAAVSRGAQTHHYPTKHELVVAAIERLFTAEAQRFVSGFERLAAADRTLGAAVRELWRIVDGPTYAAVLEVVVAARTDDDLRVVVHAVAAGLERTVMELLNTYFPELDRDGLAPLLAQLALAVVQGAAVSSYGGLGDPSAVVETVATLADALDPTVFGGAAESNPKRRMT